jgi:hypothetical protein
LSKFPIVDDVFPEGFLFGLIGVRLHGPDQLFRLVFFFS